MALRKSVWASKNLSGSSCNRKKYHCITLAFCFDSLIFLACANNLKRVKKSFATEHWQSAYCEIFKSNYIFLNCDYIYYSWPKNHGILWMNNKTNYVPVGSLNFHILYFLSVKLKKIIFVFVYLKAHRNKVTAAVAFHKISMNL